MRDDAGHVKFVAGNALDAYDANLRGAIMDWVLQVTESHARRQQAKPSGLGWGRRIGTVAQQFLDRRVLGTPGFPDLLQETAQGGAERPPSVVETLPLLEDCPAECRPALPGIVVALWG